MSRVKTPHRLIDEGRTGRIIARRALRRGLGNPKQRARDLAELMQEMYFKGVNQGRSLEKLRIQYATAGYSYGEGYGISPIESVVGDIAVLESLTADLGPVIPTELSVDPLPVGEEFVSGHAV